MFYCEAFRIGFEREDVDTDGGILFLEEGICLVWTGVEFYLYPTVSTALIHSVKPELTE